MTSHTAWPSAPRAVSTAQAGRTSIRVAVRAVDPLVVSGLHAMLRPASGIDLVADCEEAEVTVAVADSSGLCELLSNITVSRLVLIADDLRHAELLAAIEHGLIVLVPRGEVTTKTRLLQAISDACEGRGDLPAQQLGAVLQGMKQLQESTLGPRDLKLSGLSSREIEIFRLLADGLGTGEIAEKLMFSERTVKSVLHGLMSRLGLRNRAHAVAYALRHGLI
ncbi:response regulator transcription factor [Saccharopolyspora elongata]|uniref:Response regulator transcription factor n=2 Tax=Saccharopolyspora elongata TaxID=2530387 RepID=A0A4R4XU16_9PSEU|nr:response regulator transcription factor [Saccharopolyspora elongata]